MSKAGHDYILGTHLRMDEKGCEFITSSKAFVDFAISCNTRNRDIKQRIVNEYADLMARGKWADTGQTVSFSKSGVLLNGQHRLYANRQLGYPPVPLLVVAGLEDDVQEFIDKGVKRGACDSIRIRFGSGSSTANAAAARIIAIYRRGGGFLGNERALDSEICDAYQDFRQEIEDFTPGTSKRGVTAATIAAACVAVREGVPHEVAMDFMDRITSGANLDPRSPPMKYHKHYCFGKTQIRGALSQAHIFHDTMKLLREHVAWMRRKETADA